MPQLALFQPDIPQNVGATVRLAAGLGMRLHLIEPFGFVYAARKLRRTALDYHSFADVKRHASFAAFEAWRNAHAGRLVLLTTRAATDYTAVAFAADDILMAGRESAGAPDEVHAAAELRVRIPLLPEVRSLNVVTSLAMVAGEALRQTRAAKGD
ncbi:MAG: tRNA (cytidine(34)-2'-O)-methyltransferase [Geminicoccaceae bacterium]|nr:MAG: tRNA (cytidine(34)-2'-O)-methyltransferase [Geminicoccaceae bacterium]